MTFTYYPEPLILPLTGSSGGTSFTDYSGFANTVTPVWGVSTSTAQSKFGGGSTYFDGTGDHLTVINQGAFALNTDFTIEAWVRLDSILTGAQTIFELSGESQGITLWVAGSSGFLLLYMLNGTRATDTVAFPTSVFVHVAVCRSGGKTKLFKDGVQIGSDFTYPNPIINDKITIGTTLNSLINDVQSKFKGYMNDFCISKVAKYPNNFTPPTSALSLTPISITVTPSGLAQPTKIASAWATPTIAPKSLVPVTIVADVWHGGAGVISGTVRDAGTPDVAAVRRVRLHRKRDGLLIRETWSHADGAYSFQGVANQLYYITSFDHTGNYNAVIKDSITPEVM